MSSKLLGQLLIVSSWVRKKLSAQWSFLCVYLWLLRPFLIYCKVAWRSSLDHFAKTSPRLFVFNVTLLVRLCTVLRWLMLTADWLVSLSTIMGCCQPFIARWVHLRTTEEETATTENKKTEAFIIQLEQPGTRMITAARTETKQAMCFCGKLLKNWVKIACRFCIKNQSDQKMSLPRGRSCVKTA